MKKKSAGLSQSALKQTSQQSETVSLGHFRVAENVHFTVKPASYEAPRPKKKAPENHARHLFTKHCQTEVEGVAGMVDRFTGEVTSGFKLHYVNDPLL